MLSGLSSPPPPKEVYTNLPLHLPPECIELVSHRYWLGWLRPHWELECREPVRLLLGDAQVLFPLGILGPLSLFNPKRIPRHGITQFHIVTKVQTAFLPRTPRFYTNFIGS